MNQIKKSLIMEKIFEKGILLLSFINPCGSPRNEPTQEEYPLHEMRIFRTQDEDSTIRLLLLLENISQLYNKAIKKKEVPLPNQMHLIEIQTIITQFQKKMSRQDISKYNILPALTLLSESLEADALVWDNYYQDRTYAKQPKI